MEVSTRGGGTAGWGCRYTLGLQGFSRGRGRGGRRGAGLCGVTAGHSDLGGWRGSKVTGVVLLTVGCLVTVMVGMGELAALALTAPGI